MSTSGSLSATIRTVLGTIIFLLALLVLVGGWTIPFTFESSSILYRFGLEKIYLRSGKVVGISAAILVFFQLLLASRFTVLEQVFSIKRLVALHRINGIAITVLVLSHPLLIKASENFTPYTFEKKYYPEFLGMALLAVLLVLAATAMFRYFFNLSYAGWLQLHRLSATLVLFLLPAHILYVSETFKSGIPRNGALVIFCLNLLMMIRIQLRRFSQKAKSSRP